MSIHKDESGFTLVEVLLVLITLVIVGIAGYSVALHIDHKPKPTNIQSKTNSNNYKYVGPTNFTGIYGTVTEGLCPDVQINHPCPPTPVTNVNVSATETSVYGGNVPVFKTKTDSTGSYHVETGSGSFSINFYTSLSGYPVCSVTPTVKVIDGKSSRYDEFCDSGVR
ncbi:MAG TPA: prepilin-type N-terminal cleavage/methylation domain-containing protein [Candidatus Saccharimonadales bacterium]|nr:prepilin-type N-terminal cleavage/methylation domain-containing protein [Candidatus Saccharimonadales bacterium]